MKTSGIAIVGAGPAGLMAADVLGSSGHRVVIIEKRPGPARKLFIAGSSGLNISHSMPLSEFIQNYTGPKEFWDKVFQSFSPDDWLSFVEKLGIGTFKGSSGRYFVETMNAGLLVKLWRKRLKDFAVEFRFGKEVSDFISSEQGVDLIFASGDKASFDRVIFAAGGGSYEPEEKPLRWPEMFIRKGIGFTPFYPSNVGYQISWKAEFLKEAEGQPLKNIRFTSSRGTKLGELVVTNYGLEGTPIYTLGAVGTVELDLKPDLSLGDIVKRLSEVKENLSPFRRVKKKLQLSPAALALLFHHSDAAILKSIDGIAQLVKHLPLRLDHPQSLEEAISSGGGIHLGEIDEHMMLKKVPGVYLAGEMLDWDAPTGGFLIQACVSQGYLVGKNVTEG